jgi:hypothetical protein
MPVGRISPTMKAMITSSYPTLAALTLIAGLLMARVGLSKKMLSWKQFPPRHSTPGRRRLFWRLSRR